ncbi:peroxidasin homolog [Nephila pilipes]|uniref:Peroxidasin homolog n=1 Tax=Nephila pilipes TaxID=299642 RepID=A0A8X6J093_NEPPI|nr:peroxidasin homolog [Nephila pilipes]
MYFRLKLFLLVVTLLLVFENLVPTSSDEIILENDLLGSTMKFKKKFPDKFGKDNDTDTKEKKYLNKKLDKAKDWLEEWKKAYDIDDYEVSLKKRVKAEEELLELLKSFQALTNRTLTQKDMLEIIQDTFEDNFTTGANFLSSPLKYNKKSFDKTWQDKKEKYVKTNEKNKEFWKPTKYDHNESIKTKNFLEEDSSDSPEASTNLLGSPFKYNKKALDKTWQEKKDLVKSKKDFNDKKWDKVDKGWKKIFPLGSSNPVSKEGTDENQQSAPDKADIQHGITKWDNVDKGWKKFSVLSDKTVKEMQEFLEAWETAEKKLKSEMSHEYEIQKEIGGNCTKISNRSVAAPSGCPFANFLQAPAVSQSAVNCALMAEQVRRELGKCIDISFMPKDCKPVWRTKCFSAYKYRKIDGTCNNQVHPTWGKSGTPFVRMVAPDYSDGVSSVRVSKSGEPLPNPRYLSHKLYSKNMKPDLNITLLLVTFGLLIDHDMVQTAINTNSIPCCDEKFDKYPENRPKECLQIDIPEGDPFYSSRNVKCLNFVRSIPVHGECGGRREQLNKATSFLDGSTIYGSTIDKTKTLRSFKNGQLRTQRINDTPYMASPEGIGVNCGTPSEPLKCFAAGDSRVNMLVALMAMHTLWYREHNRIAEELHKLNPQWSDETIFQEARKILIGELQHITYNEFLPLLLGEEAMNFFQLNIEPDEFYDGYDATINPSVFNVFGAAAFRFGHSLIKDMLNLVGPDNKTEGSVPLHETYFNAQLLYHNRLDSLLRGVTSQKINSVDSFISKEVREHLFQPPDKDFGHDLAAVGIQRGRDHGIPSYNKWRTVCGLSELKSWDDLESVMNSKRVKNLKEVYKVVDDIELIPGGLAENPVEGSLLGPTYTCLIGRQFKKTRKGDRFWYEMTDGVGTFTRDQLKEIYNSNIARIICDNSDKIQSIQKSTFTVMSAKNPVFKCEEIPGIDLSKWKAYY